MKSHLTLFQALFFLASLLAGFVAGYLWRSAQLPQPLFPIRENSLEYTFIHPLLATGLGGQETPTADYISLAKEVGVFVDEQKARKALEDISVYFINYKQNGSFGINLGATYEPASLFKLMVMMEYLKEADADPAILSKNLTYSVDILKLVDARSQQAPSELKIGGVYSVLDLINKMIISSDNGAFYTLTANINKDRFKKMYTDLGLRFPDGKSTYTISAKDYSLFFRVLYNATYLSRENSEKALSILSKTTFRDGLAKNLPSKVLIAHKFGERVQKDAAQNIESVELHDCGIIYAGNGPYLLCVMTHGKDFDLLSGIIGSISKMVYSEVESE